MSRKDFNALARAISQITNMVDRGRVADLIADTCAASNPRFDRRRFLAACGL